MREVAAFLGVAALVIVTPGQDTALTIRNTLLGGRRAGAFTAFGVVTGQLVWAVATSAGLSAVILASESAFVALKLVGAAYLVYLGARALLGVFRRDDVLPATNGSAPHRQLSSRVAYRQGDLIAAGQQP